MECRYPFPIPSHEWRLFWEGTKFWTRSKLSPDKPTEEVAYKSRRYSESHKRRWGSLKSVWHFPLWLGSCKVNVDSFPCLICGSHRRSGALAGWFLNTWHLVHCRIHCSIYVLMLGYQKCICATYVVFTIPAWVLCNSAIAVLLILFGITTCKPLRMQPE